MKTLIPLSDFVIQQEEIMNEILENSFDVSQDSFAKYQFILRVMEYARFLKQPLTLGMFVPVDEDGDAIVLPRGYYSKISQGSDCEECKIYQKAKEKVLFEGFQVEWQSEIIIGVMNKMHVSIAFDKKTGVHGVKQNIEYLSNYELELTPSALKAIGINE